MGQYERFRKTELNGTEMSKNCSTDLFKKYKTKMQNPEPEQNEKQGKAQTLVAGLWNIDYPLGYELVGKSLR